MNACAGANAKEIIGISAVRPKGIFEESEPGRELSFKKPLSGSGQGSSHSITQAAVMEQWVAKRKADTEGRDGEQMRRVRETRRDKKTHRPRRGSQPDARAV